MHEHVDQIMSKVFDRYLTDTTLTNDLNASHVVSPLPQPLSLGQVQQGDDEGLLQLEPPITSSEYSFSLDEEENLHDLFDSLPFSLQFRYFCFRPPIPPTTSLLPAIIHTASNVTQSKGARDFKTLFRVTAFVIKFVSISI